MLNNLNIIYIIIKLLLNNSKVLLIIIKVYKIFRILNPLLRLLMLLINYFSKIDNDCTCYNDDDNPNNYYPYNNFLNRYNHRLYMMYLDMVNRLFLRRERRHANILQNNNMEEYIGNLNPANYPDPVYWNLVSWGALYIVGTCVGIWILYKGGEYVYKSLMEDDIEDNNEKVSEKDLLNDWINSFD